MKVWLRIFLVGLAAVLPAVGQDAAALRRERDGLIERGLWKDAVTFYQEKLSPLSDGESGNDLGKAVEALARLSDAKGFDALVEESVAGHRENPEVLLAAATAYAGAVKHGAIVAGT
ncbi:MAG TPA: hypothetical protein VM511_02160, partial [Luteolibacter sp.]|nr:hypothetical protein [Luteolibacter sp.]